MRAGAIQAGPDMAMSSMVPRPIDLGPIPEAAGETISWSRLREILSVQQRVTATFRQRDGRTLHVRKATAAEPALRKIYDALGIEAAPGGVKKLIV